MRPSDVLPRGVVAALVALLPAGCHRSAAPPPAAPHPHYVVGGAWQGADGAWFYPAEHFDGSFGGLAVPTTRAPGTLTADGELADPVLATAAVQSLQLPCVLRVTDLASGRQILVRANDRGPPDAGRVLALDARARQLLGMGTAPTPVRVEIDGPRSLDLQAALGGGPRVAIASAPLGEVAETSLPPPGGGAAALPAARPAAASAAAVPPDADAPLPETVTTLPVTPWSLWLDGGRFTVAASAERAAEAIGGEVVVEGHGRAATYHVRRGPFASVVAADAALDQVRRAGISGARISAE